MAEGKRFLVRCAGCGRNFETIHFGRQSCPICHAEVLLDPPAGLVVPEDSPNETAREAPSGAESIDPAKRSAGGDAIGSEERRAQAEPEKSPDDEPKESDTGAPGEYVPPWESSSGSILTRFYFTVREVFSFPLAFFGRMRLGPTGRVLVFGWLMCTIAAISVAVYSLWALGLHRESMLASLKSSAELVSRGESPEAMLETLEQWLRWMLYGSPVLGLINMVLTSLLYHLGVVLFAREERGFGATLRATAYGFAPMLLVSVPVIGMLLGGLWTVVLQIVALAQVHRMGPGRATLAVLLPTAAFLIALLTVFPLILR